MKAKSAERRRNLFDLYSRNYATVTGQPGDVVVCPLCGGLFGRTDLAGPNPELTLAHVVSQKLGGGSFCTLACKRCNNDRGGEWESSLMERLRADDYMAGIGRVTGRLSGPFGNVGAEFALGPTGLSVYAVHQQSNPAALAAMTNYLNVVAGDPNVALDLSFAVAYDHQPKAARAAIYQSALLAMFKHFGYWFLFHPHFKPLREQVARPEEDILSSRFPLVSGESVANLPSKRSCAIVFLHELGAIQVLLRMRLAGGLGKCFAVVLPGLDSPDMPSVDKQNFHGDLIPYREDWLRRPENILRGLWAYTRKGRQGQT